MDAHLSFLETHRDFCSDRGQHLKARQFAAVINALTAATARAEAAEAAAKTAEIAIKTAREAALLEVLDVIQNSYNARGAILALINKDSPKMLTEREIERRNRIKWAVAAYAYQVKDDPVMTDAQFDKLARKIRPNVMTGNILCDVYFLTKFESHTASMITHHPEINGIAHIYNVMGDLIRDYNIEGWRPPK